jgi:hypothetical protein
VTTVPFQLGEGEGGVGPTLNEFHAPDGRGDGRARKSTSPPAPRDPGNGGRRSVAAKLGTASVVIADVEWRQRACATGTISAPGSSPCREHAPSSAHSSTTPAASPCNVSRPGDHRRYPDRDEADRRRHGRRTITAASRS